jgi:F0F1-type ATP synthase assembly protein I
MIAMTEPPQPRRNPFAGASAGYLPLGGAVVGFGGGWLVDRAAGTMPVWTLVLGTLFLAVGMYHMIREAKR